jgi:hypothetical protein
VKASEELGRNGVLRAYVPILVLYSHYISYGANCKYVSHSRDIWQSAGVRQFLRKLQRHALKWFPQARRIQGGLTRQDIGFDGQSNYFYQGIVVEKAIHLFSSFGQLQLFDPKSALDSPTQERDRIFT